MVLLTTVFSYINEPDNSFGILNQETVIIRAAKVAYACNQYNIKSKITELNNIKKQINIQGLNGLKRIVNYYLGLCHEKVLNDKLTNYMQKSSQKGFLLANLYIEHIKFNFEHRRKQYNPYKHRAYPFEVWLLIYILFLGTTPKYQYTIRIGAVAKCTHHTRRINGLTKLFSCNCKVKIKQKFRWEFVI